MILRLVERNTFLEALRLDFDPTTLESMLSRRLDRRLHDLVPAGLTFPKMLETVVSTAEQEGWTWNLIEAAVAHNPGGPNLAAFLQRFARLDPRTAAPPAAVDVLSAYLLRAGRIFIDREDLRAALRDLRDDPRSSHVLVVTGERASGKTYTAELLTFFASMAQKHKAIYVDLDKFPYTAKDLAETMGRQMGQLLATIPEHQDEQRARWVLRLCDWITAHMINSGDVTYWCVFDGFREVTLPDETKDLIGELAQRAESTVPQCRVVLLNYNEVLPLRIEDYVRRERIKTIERDDLIKFFEQVNRDNADKYTPEFLAEKVDVIRSQVDQALDGNPQAQAQRLRLLGRAVNETRRALYAEQET